LHLNCVGDSTAVSKPLAQPHDCLVCVNVWSQFTRSESSRDERQPFHRPQMFRKQDKRFERRRIPEHLVKAFRLGVFRHHRRSHQEAPPSYSPMWVEVRTGPIAGSRYTETPSLARELWRCASYSRQDAPHSSQGYSILPMTCELRPRSRSSVLGLLDVSLATGL